MSGIQCIVILCCIAIRTATPANNATKPHLEINPSIENAPEQSKNDSDMGQPEQPVNGSGSEQPIKDGGAGQQLESSGTGPSKEDSIIESPRFNKSLDHHYIEDVMQLKNRVTRIEDALEIIHNTMQSMQTQLKSGQKHETTQAGNYFEVNTGKQIFTYDWYISNVSQLNSIYQEGDSIKSPRFYVSPRGYRMFMITYPVGRHDLPILSLDYLNIYGGPVRGAYDAQLIWPFRLRFDMGIVDQTDEDPQNIYITIYPGRTCGRIPTDTKGKLDSDYKLYFHDIVVDRYQYLSACGEHNLISRKLLATRNYIKDDRILFRMKVYLF